MIDVSDENGEMFDLYIEDPAGADPASRRFFVVILDNLSSPQKPGGLQSPLRDIGAWFVFLPPYSPDLNPIEMAFLEAQGADQKGCRPNLP